MNLSPVVIFRYALIRRLYIRLSYFSGLYFGFLLFYLHESVLFPVRYVMHFPGAAGFLSLYLIINTVWRSADSLDSLANTLRTDVLHRIHFHQHKSCLDLCHICGDKLCNTLKLQRICAMHIIRYPYH